MDAIEFLKEFRANCHDNLLQDKSSGSNRNDEIDENFQVTECSQESTIIGEYCHDGDDNTLLYDIKFARKPQTTVEANFQDVMDNLNCEEFQLITDEGDTSNCVEELQLEPKEATSVLNHKYSFQSTKGVEEIFQDGAVNLNCEEFQLITDEFALVGEGAGAPLNSGDNMQFEAAKTTGNCLFYSDQINVEITHHQGGSANFNEKTLETNMHDAGNKSVTLDSSIMFFNEGGWIQQSMDVSLYKENVRGSDEDDNESLVTIIEYDNIDDSTEGDMEMGDVEVLNEEDVVADVSALKVLLKQKEETSLTKSGHERRRHKFSYSQIERQSIKQQIVKLEHRVKPPCSHPTCLSLISESRRHEINSQFWSLDLKAQCTFGYATISRQDCKRKTEEANRDNSFTYFLKNDKGSSVIICKTFYLTTLGYNRSNDSFVRMLVGRKNYLKPLPRKKQQGLHLKKTLIDRTPIIEHIYLFGPTISHYRREHAPKRLYLASDITISFMYKDFKEKFPNVCSYDLYRKVVSEELNISFAHLGNEECEQCEKFKLHTKSNPTHSKQNLVLNCSICVEFKAHRQKYTESRELYSSHKNLSTPRHAYDSMDLQKIIMLPRIDMFKEVIFCPRLSILNECFVPIGRKGKEGYRPQPFASLWHEAISGRKKEDFISCFYKYFVSKRDLEDFTIWLDNCGAQNKNWALYTFLVYIINSNLIEAKSIELYYFEPGHTFMSADSFHHRIELSLKQMKKVYDFNDFKSAVEKAGNPIIAEMGIKDFFDWPDCSSRTKRTEDVYMKDIVYVRAERGKKTLVYKTEYKTSEEYELDFLQLKAIKNGIPEPQIKTKYRGITKARKENIIQKLGPLMPENRLSFWENVPETLKEVALYDCDNI